MNQSISQDLTNLSYWTVSAYYVDTDNGDGGEICQHQGKWSAYCSGQMKVAVGPLVAGQEVQVTMVNERVTFNYHKTLVSHPRLKDDEDEDEHEQVLNDFYSNFTEEFVMQLAPPSLKIVA